jgi:hypothetical protein
MNFRLILAVAWVFAGGGAAWTAPGSAKAEIEGQALAQQLIAQKPAENSTISGLLKIRDGKGNRREIPVQSLIGTTPTNWHSVYETSGSSNATGLVKLEVIHCENAPNQYRLWQPVAAGGYGGEGRVMTGREVMMPFAGSDFWLADLGLEFLHWPGQRLLKKEMRRGQSCNVLESVDSQPAAGGYSRVVSWLDIDTGGIVHAEAYDAHNKLLKEFDPKEFKKVNGRWELREMEIRNVKERSSTRLEFNLDNK